jgi:DNA-binding YbaB/EbfC family protein
MMKRVKQAQQMQAKMARLDEELAREEFEVSSGGGAVTVRMNAKNRVLRITIREDVAREGDKEMLEELIAAAVNQAHERATEITRERVAAITGGMNLPGLF